MTTKDNKKDVFYLDVDALTVKKGKVKLGGKDYLIGPLSAVSFFELQKVEQDFRELTKNMDPQNSKDQTDVVNMMIEQARIYLNQEQKVEEEVIKKLPFQALTNLLKFCQDYAKLGLVGEELGEMVEEAPKEVEKATQDAD